MTPAIQSKESPRLYNRNNLMDISSGTQVQLEHLQYKYSITEHLLNQEPVPHPKPEPVWSRLKRSVVGPSVSKSARNIMGNGTVFPANYFPNIIRNQRYNIFSFVPLTLYNQFKFFFNFFFLMTSISQLFPILQVGFLISFLGPLLLVLCLNMLKEAYDDYQRYKRDKEANSSLYKVVGDKGAETVRSAELQVGQVIQIQANQRVPADVLLLHGLENSGSVFVRTDQLDGETDWKLRKSIRHTQKSIQLAGMTNYDFITKEILQETMSSCFTECQAPSQLIYDFEGTFGFIEHGEIKREALSLENTLWAGTVLASSTVLAQVIFTGKETRMQMNGKTSRNKFGKLDCEINFLSKLLFLYLLSICVIMVVLKGGPLNKDTLSLFFRYVILLSSVIPISMRVNLDFAKLLYCFRINRDKRIPGTVARNSNIPEELGRIKYLLSDKTGTLTQNDMIFRRLSLERTQFSYEDEEEIKRMILKNTQKYQGGLMQDVVERENEGGNMVSQVQMGIRREKESLIRDSINALALCHNVTPVVDAVSGEKTFQASSPDEIALVKTAEQMGVLLKDRTEQFILLQNALGQEEHYEILASFPFTSQSKRQGIVLKRDGQILFLMKGADVIMKNKVSERQRGFLMDECEELSTSGLRTLCFAYKRLKQQEFDSWHENYKRAQLSMTDRKAQMERQLEILEQGMMFLCITGVEDKLQEDVSKTIENMRNAGMCIWMLTGDKIETAQCIAISAGLRNDPGQQMVVISEIEDTVELRYRLDQFSNSANNSILVIDGQSLGVALLNFDKYFIEVSCQAPAVVCCRCSPTQKAQITEVLKKFTKKQVAAIGDGGNDVGMIQSADVGIGVVGKEGKQAALAADFSINQFNYLNQLVLWHGRNSYKRSAVLSQFVMHRGLIISQVQTVFSLVFYYVSMSIYNGMLNLGYSTVFTNLPIFCLIFDQELDERTALGYPPLYQTMQKNRDLNLKTFLGWCFKSLYQGTVIMLLGIYVYQDSYFVQMVTISFSCLILTEYLNVYSELHSVHIVMIISQLASALIYFLTIVLMPNMFNVASIDGVFIWKTICMTFISWFPFHLFKILKRYLDPSDYEVIMKGAQQKILRNI